MNRGIEIAEEEFEELFPFYLEVNPDGQTVSCGKSLFKLFPNIIDKPFCEFFQFVKPFHTTVKFSQPNTLISKIIIISKNGQSELMFRGQFVKAKKFGNLIFVGAPWIINADDLLKYNISINDFALHNSVPDLVQIIKSKDLLMEDYQQMLASLNGQKEKLKSSTNTLHSLILSMSNGLILENCDRKLIYANPAFCSLFNIPMKPEQLIGSDCKEAAEHSKFLFTNEEEFTLRIEEILSDMQPVFEEDITMKDGRILRRDFIPVRSSGIHIGHMWMYKDVTREVNSSKQLAYNEEKFRSVIENLELGLLEVNPENIITKIYKGFCDMLGYTEGELLGTNVLNLLATEKDHKIVKQETNDRLFGKSSVYEVRMKKKNGDLIWVTISGAPLYNSKREVVGSIGIHWDITERKEKAKELLMAKEMAEKSVKVKQEFLANMSHEIRTPLNVILGYSDLLADSSLNSIQLNDIHQIQNSAEHLLMVINDILDISKIESGNVKLAEEPFSLTKLANQLYEQMKVLAVQKNIELSVKCDEKLPSLVIGDPYRLNQILYNLLSNAIKFTNQGGVVLNISFCNSENASELWVLFNIIDTGIGIKKEEQSLIFKSFTQSTNSHNRKFGGTGLGLSIVSELVRLFKGRIEVQSEIGIGSEFRIKIPFIVSKLAKQTDSISLCVTDNSNIKIKVLAVEDNELNKAVLSRYLDKWQMIYDFAEDGKKAVLLASKNQYDVILMDVQLPETDGYEVTKLLRKTEGPNKNTPIIGLTAHAIAGEKEKCLKAGMNEHEPKPFNPERLKSKICGEVNRIRSKNKINLDYLRDVSDNDSDFIAKTIQLFVEESSGLFNELLEICLNDKTNGKDRILHKLKPGMIMFGLSDMYYNLETTLLQNPPDVSKLKEMQKEFFAIYESLKIYK